MLTRQRRPMGLTNRLSYLPWWAYILLIPGFYLFGWVLHLLGVIPGQ
ncbi:hypothetical protein KBK19_12910 [Microvirga sp. STR05]|uniref:Uncharacterized protein n=1 Tax=Hymenobacter duratus TaxID=2771356 RepID=A0ABR8JGE9_9BACT|nr:hypothetical protein [Hymenobacter duratus]MBD2715935.1 hypothetical protein [Hymenobacter duratus]MBR7950849.1 hypothetical protein [Microvirga sp. STR05]